MQIIKYAKIFFVLIASYVILMWVAFSLPSGMLDKHSSDAFEIFKREGVYYAVNKDYPEATQVDNFTDMLVMVPLMKREGSAIGKAMDMNGYSRYWHGYATFLRPLLTVFNYQQIRIIYNIVVLSLICTCFYFIAQRIGFLFALSFSFSLAMIHVEVFGMSMQYSNIFIITMISSIFLLRNDLTSEQHLKNSTIYFFVIGSITNFIDLLTYPVFSLGMPLCLLILIINKNSEIKSNILYKVISCSLAWAIGYSMTWASKWLVASLILHRYVFSEALNQAAFRVEGNAEYPLNRYEMIYNNFHTMFMYDWFIYLLCIIVLISGILLIKEKPLLWLSLICLSIMPYVWYMALANHSQIHFFFTFRSQAVTLFSVMSLGILSYMQWKKR